MDQLSQTTKLVHCSPPKDYSSAVATIEYISLKLGDKIRFIIDTGAWAGGTAAVTLKQATDVAASGAKALSFAEYFTGTGDTLTRTTATANTFNLAAANTKYVIEVNAADLDVDNSFDCVSCQVASPGANADLYVVMAEVYDLRYEKGPASPTMITD